MVPFAKLYIGKSTFDYGLFLCFRQFDGRYFLAARCWVWYYPPLFIGWLNWLTAVVVSGGRFLNLPTLFHLKET
jgi:hypothetical protein